MKRFFVLISCLALLSLACLTTGAVMELTPSPSPTGEGSLAAATVESITAVSVFAPTAESDCARVIAYDALHLRDGAGVEFQVIGYLAHDQVVRVINQDEAEWWMVSDGTMSGYARSLYLASVECR